MKNCLKPLFLSALWLSWTVLPVTSVAQHFHSDHKVIYDQDNRVESLDHPNPLLREYAHSVAGMVRKYFLYDSPPRQSKKFEDFRDDLLTVLGQDFLIENEEFFSSAYRSYLKTSAFPGEVTTVADLAYFHLDKERTLQRNMRVCAHERFAKQVVLSQCTGFLIADDLLMTAGHCMQTESHCKNFKWIFGHYQGVDKVLRDDVYGCQEVVSSRLTASVFSTRDYAIVRLDRKVKNRKPLPLNIAGHVEVGEELALIGHPSGLPMKTADNAQVTRRRINFFYANLDSYSGNSGSPVINTRTGEVEGILIQGAKDYDITENGCYVSARKVSTRRGADEKVFRINRIPDLAELIE